MKKMFSWLTFVLATSLVLTACSQQEGEKVKDIFKHTVNATSELDSFAASMELNQQVSIPEIDEPLSFTMKSDAKIQTNPAVFYQQLSALDEVTEMYVVEEGLFVQNAETNEWVKAPDPLTKRMNLWVQLQQNPSQQLEKLEKHIDKMQFEEKENHYVLTLVSSDDSLKGLVKEMLSQNGLTEGMETAINNLTVKNITYTFVIDKEQFIPQTFELTMELAVNRKDSDKPSTISQNIKVKYSQFNEIEEIGLP
ncbi:MAG: hypothetical protein H0Z32_09615 [Bacillaceae bacterium]|nr:hypothetical protein [Bacillaceae bacterium]